MRFISESKMVHFILLLIVVVCGFIFLHSYPCLFKDAPTTFGTVSAFLTAYGVLFAVIELLRVKNAVKQAEDEAKRVFNAVIKLETAREIIECQAKIEIALNYLNEEKLIPAYIRRGILQLYSQIFHEQFENEQCSHRDYRAIVESYDVEKRELNSNSNNNKKRTKLIQTLNSIVSQLAQLQGNTKIFTEYKK